MRRSVARKSRSPTRLADARRALHRPDRRSRREPARIYAYLGFWLANQRVIEREAIMTEIKELKEATKENTKALEEARSQCKDESRSLSVIESRTAATQAEIVVIQSKLSK